MLRQAVTARRSSKSIVRDAFAAEPLQPSIQLSPALRMLKISLIPLMTPLERSESWEVQQQALHQRIRREKELTAERERSTPHWTQFYHRCLAERPILTKVRIVSASHALRWALIHYPAAQCTCQPHACASMRGRWKTYSFNSRPTTMPPRRPRPPTRFPPMPSSLSRLAGDHLLRGGHRR